MAAPLSLRTTQIENQIGDENAWTPYHGVRSKGIAFDGTPRPMKAFGADAKDRVVAPGSSVRAFGTELRDTRNSTRMIPSTPVTKLGSVMAAVPLTTMKGGRSALRNVTNENAPTTQMKPFVKRRFGDDLTSTALKPKLANLDSNTSQIPVKAQLTGRFQLQFDDSALKARKDVKLHAKAGASLIEEEPISSSVRDDLVKKDVKAKTAAELIALNDIDGLAELYAEDGVETMPMSGDDYEKLIKAQADEEIRQRVEMVKSIRMDFPCFYGQFRQYKDPDVVPFAEEAPMPSPPGGKLPWLSQLDDDDYLFGVPSSPDLNYVEVDWSSLE